MGVFGKVWGALAGEPVKPAASTSGSIVHESSHPVVDDEARLKQELIDAESVSSCLRVYKCAREGSPLEALAIDKISKIARYFAEWLEIYFAISPASSLGKRALTQLLETAVTFSDWSQMYNHSFDEATRAVAISKMAALAHGQGEQIRVYGLAPEGPIKEAMFVALKAKVVDKCGWREVLEVSEDDLRTFAAERVIEMTEPKLSALSDLLSEEIFADDEDLKKKVLARVITVQASLDEWIKVLGDEDTPYEVRKVALQKVVDSPEAAAKGFSGWEAILNGSDEGSDLEEHAAKMVVEVAPLDDPVVVEGLLGYSQISDNDDLNKKVLEKLRATPAELFDGWKKVYGDTEDDDVKKIAEAKLVESINSVARLIDVNEIVEKDDREEEFDEALRAKAEGVLLDEADCRKMVENYYADGTLFSAALRRLLVLSKSTKERLDLFLGLLNDWHTEDDETNDELLGEVIEKLLAEATPDEIYIMAKLGEEFGDLGSRAQALIK